MVMTINDGHSICLVSASVWHSSETRLVQFQVHVIRGWHTAVPSRSARNTSTVVPFSRLHPVRVQTISVP